MRDTDLAWAAGIIDGEGCISLARNKRSFRLRLWVGNNDERMVMQLNEIFTGGGICISRPKGKAQYIWHVNGKEAAKVLELVYDYLVVKQEEANIAIAFAETIRGPGRITEDIRLDREDMFNQITAFGNRRRG